MFFLAYFRNPYIPKGYSIHFLENKTSYSSVDFKF